VEDISAIQNGKIGKGLKQFLTDEVLGKRKGKESLVVIDPHLGMHLCQPSEYVWNSLNRTVNLKKTEH